MELLINQIRGRFDPAPRHKFTFKIEIMETNILNKPAGWAAWNTNHRSMLDPINGYDTITKIHWIPGNEWTGMAKTLCGQDMPTGLMEYDLEIQSSKGVCKRCLQIHANNQ